MVSGPTYAFEESGSHHVHLLRNGVLEVRPWWLDSGSGSGSSVCVSGSYDYQLLMQQNYRWVKRKSNTAAIIHETDSYL